MKHFLGRWAYAWATGIASILSDLVWILTLGMYHPMWGLWLMLWIVKKGWQY